MGWPRTKDSCRLYLDRTDSSYVLVIVENGQNGQGHWDCIANVQQGSNPTLCSTGCSPEFLRTRCKRVEWSELPEVWQKAFRSMMRDWDVTDPAKIRGFWKLYWKGKSVQHDSIAEVGQTCPRCKQAVLEDEYQGMAAGCPACGHAYPTTEGVRLHGSP
jgi:hypothetical protein